MANTKVIIMDIDGTLAQSNNTIDTVTQNMLLEAQEKGVKLVLASGRPTTGLAYYANALRLHEYNGLLVSYNGSKVVDAQTQEVLFNQPLENHRKREILRHMKQFNVTTMVDDGTYLYVNNVDGVNVAKEAKWCNLKVKYVPDMEMAIDFTVNKILISGEPAYLKRISDAMKAPFADDHSCVFSAPFYFEITAENIDKGQTLSQVLLPLGYEAAECMAFGDGHNDATMLNFAGTAVAMGNAVEAIKEASDYVTRNNNESGIAYALRYFDIIK